MTENQQGLLEPHNAAAAPTDVIGRQSTTPNSQVKAKQGARRRKFSAAYKVDILARYEACSNALARGELLRKEGLYHSRLSAWRKERDNGTLTEKKHPKSINNKNLTRENARLKKELAQAHTVIEIQKKVSELLGLNTHQTDSTESS